MTLLPYTSASPDLIIFMRIGSKVGRSGHHIKTGQRSIVEEGEYFNVCIFSEKPLWCSTTGQIAATQENVKAAKAFVNKTSLFNGTEIGIAL
jgi:hypothetical protein